MKTLKSFNVKNKRVLVRVDFNVPLDKKGNITNDKRIKSALPTINYLLKKKASVVLMSHLGRPKGKKVKILTMDKVGKRLSKLLKKKVYKLDKCIGKDVENIVKTKDIVLLENLRFYKEEKNNNKQFAKSLARLADVYVNDAFGTCHRAHASVEAITKYLPSGAGLLLEKEIKKLNLKKPKRPFVSILGCAKISDKIDLITALLPKVDKLLLGGLVVFTFLKAQGIDVGLTKTEDDKLKLARQLLKKYPNKIIIPIDVKVAKGRNDAPKTVNINNIPKNKLGFDIGPKSVKLFTSELKKAKTVLWNGPLGWYENKKYAKGTNVIAKFLSKSKAKVIIGGGDTANAVKKYEKKYYHVSTGGGASLEYISGKTLPAIKALK